MTAVAVLEETLARGGKVLLDPNRPRLFAPPSLHDAIRADRETVKEILRRAVVFREQAAGFSLDGRPLPLLALPEHSGNVGCISCGSPLSVRRYRCEVCTLAVALALAGMP